MAGFGTKKEQTAVKRLTIHQLAGKELAKQAENHYKKGELRSAESLYRQAFNIGFQNRTLNENLGKICWRSGREKEALQWYSNILKIDPSHQSNYIIYVNLGRINSHLGRHDKAINFLLKSLEIKPDDPVIHLILGGLYKDLGKLDQALTSILKSLEIKPDNHIALVSLGDIYKDLGKLDQALAYMLKSLEIMPKNHVALAKIGCIYNNLGKLDHANASFLKSLELKPDNHFALSQLLTTYESVNLNSLKAIALKIINQNKSRLNELGFIEAISSLGEEFTMEALEADKSSAGNTLN